MGLVKWDPFIKDLLFLQERMSRIFDEALMHYRGFSSGGSWFPPVDIFETPEKIILKAELPGVEIEDVSIEVEENIISLKGERKLRKNASSENYHRMERFYGNFQRVFSLPNIVNKESVRANFKDGVLEITVPKVVEPAQRGVKISVE